MSQYNKLTEDEKELWKQAIDLALEALFKKGWDIKNSSKKFDVIYNGQRIPPKEVIHHAFIYLFDNNVQTSVNNIKGGNDTITFLQSFGLEVVSKKKS